MGLGYREGPLLARGIIVVEQSTKYTHYLTTREMNHLRCQITATTAISDASAIPGADEYRRLGKPFEAMNASKRRSANPFWHSAHFKASETKAEVIVEWNEAMAGVLSLAIVQAIRDPRMATRDASQGFRDK
jgi:hypothetical protein